MIGSPIACLLKLAQSDGVGAHQRQNRQTEHYEYDVEHDRLLAGAVLSSSPRKLSIANCAVPRKDLISFRPAATDSGCPGAWNAREIRSTSGKTKRAGRQFRKGTVAGALQFS
jgi:hypothetical protein